MLTFGAGVGVALDVMVKSVSEISKKIFPTASTFIRAVVVGVLGIETDSAPSFAVLAERIIGNVLPPSVESKILTFATLTGGKVVFAAFQVTLKLLCAGILTAVFGAVTLNGPEVFVTVTVMSVNCV